MKKYTLPFLAMTLLVSGSVSASVLEVENQTNQINPISVISEQAVVLEKKVLTTEEIFMQNIKNAKNEAERREVLTQYKKSQVQKVQEKVGLLEERTEEIFGKFDIILEKMDLVKSNIESNIVLLEEKNINLAIVNEKTAALNSDLNLAKEEKANAWIKMQNINFSGDKDLVVSELAQAKKHLTLSRDGIMRASTHSKEIIFFIRGALSHLE